MAKRLTATDERNGNANDLEQNDAANFNHRNDLQFDDQIENSPRHLARRPSRFFDALTASPQMSRVWRAAAGVCLIAALFCWWNNHFDAVFVVAALGVIAWFLNVRGHLHRATNTLEELPRERNE
jgi:hypothetical protein